MKLQKNNNQSIQLDMRKDTVTILNVCKQNTDMFLLRRLVGCRIGQLDEMVKLIQQLLAGGVDLSTRQGEVVTRVTWHVAIPRCRPGTWPRTGSGDCGWTAPAPRCRCWPAPPRSSPTIPSHSRYTKNIVDVGRRGRLLTIKYLHFLLSGGTELTVIRL